MDQIFQPLEPAQPPPPVEPAPVETRSSGLRRAALTAAISALLLVGGGVAAVSAASPAPSTAPGTTTPGTTPPAGRPAMPHSGSTAELPEHGWFEWIRQLGRLEQPEHHGPGACDDAGDLASPSRAARFGGSPGCRPGTHATDRRSPALARDRGRLLVRDRRRCCLEAGRDRGGSAGPGRSGRAVYATGLANVSAFAFDSDDRLWAATAAYTDDGDDALYVIASAGAAPVKVVADLHTVLGLAWSGDTLYVASSGRVDAYSGLADGAFARHATVLTLPDGTGEVNGLVISSDGRLVLGVSAPCDSCTPTTEDAAAVISFLPDGSDVRVVAGGIRAPVGLAYYPGTDDLFVTMNQRDDLGDATPGDWLSVVRSGQDWGFPDCYGQGGSACDGAPKPVAELDPHAAVSGVAIVTDGLGASIAPSALVAEWATGAVLRVGLTRDGLTWTGTRSRS